MTSALARFLLAALSAAAALYPGVVRLYHGTRLARRLHQVGKDTLARMEVTLELTESLCRNGAGKVNKTDLKARYDLVAIESQISLVVGKEVAGKVNSKLWHEDEE